MFDTMWNSHMGLVRVALFFLRVITSFTIINLLKCSLVVTLAVVSLLRFRFDLFTIFAPTKFFRPFILRFARSFSLLFMLCVFFSSFVFIAVVMYTLLQFRRACVSMSMYQYVLEIGAAFLFTFSLLILILTQLTLILLYTDVCVCLCV